MSDGLTAKRLGPGTSPLVEVLARTATVPCILLVFIATKIAVLVALAFNSMFVMDEYWMVVHGLFGLDHLYKEIWPSKTVLYAAVFRIPHLLAEGPVEIMLSARAIMSAVAIGSLTLLYLVARQIGRSRLESVFVVALVLAFRSYIEWAYIARPEPLALLFAIAGLWLATRERRSLALCLAAGVVSGIAFLTLQKAVYFNLALGLAFVGDGLARRNLKDAVASGVALVSGWGLVVSAYYVFFMALGADFGSIVGYSLTGPALNNALSGHLAYDGGLRSFLRPVIGYDLLPYLICAAGLVVSARGLLGMASLERRAWVFSVVITVLVFSHPAPWPYNFVMAVPFLGLWAPTAIRAIPAPRRLRWLVLICLAVGVMSVHYNIRYLEHDNGFQNLTVRRADSLLRPGDRYFDGVGMIVNRRHAGWDLPGQAVSWDRPAVMQIRASAERGDLRHFDRIFGGAPKVWILTYRSRALEDLLAPYLDDSYVPVYPNILLTGVQLNPGITATFRNWWPGSYQLYRADGTAAETGLEVDSRPIEGPIWLERAQYGVRLADGSEPLYLLPTDIEGVPFDMTAPLEQRALFPQTYTY